MLLMQKIPTQLAYFITLYERFQANSSLSENVTPRRSRISAQAYTQLWLLTGPFANGDDQFLNPLRSRTWAMVIVLKMCAPIFLVFSLYHTAFTAITDRDYSGYEISPWVICDEDVEWPARSFHLNACGIRRFAFLFQPSNPVHSRGHPEIFNHLAQPTAFVNLSKRLPNFVSQHATHRT